MNEELLQFPCAFSIKVMGIATDNFAQAMFKVVKLYSDDLKQEDISLKTSRNGKYLSLSINIIAQSRSQLDALYTALSQHQDVTMVL
ncbi:MAG: DUF493 domain-containing protein [Thiomargarita sp.]|nr:DUF493 domain-containing protein [Thiomargarita sp.]